MENYKPFWVGHGIVSKLIEEDGFINFTEEEIEEILFCLERVAEIADREKKLRTDLIKKLHGTLDSKR